MNDANHQECCDLVALKQAIAGFATKDEGVSLCQLSISLKTSFLAVLEILLTTSAVDILKIHCYNKKVKCKNHFQIKIIRKIVFQVKNKMEKKN